MTQTYAPQDERINRHSLEENDDEIEGYDDLNGAHLASVEEKKKLWVRNAIINGCFMLGWFTFATFLSVYNKWMFSPNHFGFPYPLFVTTLHMVVQFVLAAFLRHMWPKHFKPENRPSLSDYGKKAAPTAIASGLDIGLSNLSLKLVTLSFYTMCKSSSLIFVLLFAFLFRLERFSWRLIGVMLLIFSGVLLMVATETKFVVDGLLLVLSASALGGLRWSLTQLLLHDKKMGLDNPAATVYWLAPTMGLTLAIVSAAVDSWSKLFASKFFATLDMTISTSLYLLFPGVIAFCMVLSEFYIIQRTGVVPMSIAGIAKEVTTITISAWFFGDQLTPLNITGVSITILGIMLFTYHKYRKSMDSQVPLDAHGRPLSSDDDLSRRLSLQQNGFHAMAEDTIPLTSTSRGNRPFNDEDETIEREQLLFSADHGDDDSEDVRRNDTSKNTLPRSTEHV